MHFSLAEKEKYNSNSFRLFNRLRNTIIVTDYDNLTFLKDFSNGFELEMLEALSKDIELFISMEKEECLGKFSDDDIQKIIIERSEKGLEIPYLEKPIFKGILKDFAEKFPESKKRRIDYEKLLFPFELMNVRTFKKLIHDKIDECNSKENNIKTLEIPINFSDTKATEKIVMLHKLGVLDFLRNKEPFKFSINSLATALSGITGVDSTTIQSYINPIYSNKTNQKNNPLNSTKTVDKVDQKLISIGFKPFK